MALCATYDLLHKKAGVVSLTSRYGQEERWCDIHSRQISKYPVSHFTFIDALSKKAKGLIKYIVYKQAFKEERFLFYVNEFNRFMKYINVEHPSDGLVELCTRAVLAKTKDSDLYWVNKDLFNTGVFQPKYMECMEEDSYN